ncbi:MAG: amylo-alpha-1,6-glucosidase, partial [Longispora sp.]|nr:amylo-alpha-1,6-glucosidase [Longispora sp. (in: high G+C Gram-positive bacteria)]
MTERPGPLNAGEAAHRGTGNITLVDGTTFCISAANGDIDGASGPHGLFFQDARVVSRWELKLDGQHPQALTVLNEVLHARFVLRRPPLPGHADSTVLVVRDRLIGDGLREKISLTNLGREPTAMTVSIMVDADFADLFAVKEGRIVASVGVQASMTGADLLIHSAVLDSRGLRVSASVEPTVLVGGMSWEVIVPARGTWDVELVAEPLIGNEHFEPRFRGAEAIEEASSAWRDTNTVIEVDDPLTMAILRRTDHDLDALLITDPVEAGRAFVAAGAPWFMTLFGRDSLLAAWMTLPMDTQLAVGTLQTLASMQGQHENPLTEEEPGRILHELRRGPDSHLLGGTHYYGSVDSTPLFVMLLGECLRWGADEVYVRSLLPAADAALAWITRYGDRDGDGFVEYQRATDRGLINQGWKDSFDSIFHADGSLPFGPITLIEVQGFVYAASAVMAKLAMR